MADRKCDMVLATTARWRDTQIDAEALRWNPARQTFERWDGAAWVLLSPTFDACTISGSPADGDSSGALASTSWVTSLVQGYVTLATAQTIHGAKSFTGAVAVPVPTDDDDSAAPATTSYVQVKAKALAAKDTAIESTLTTMQGRDTAMAADISSLQKQIDDAYAYVVDEYTKAGGTV